ncbi:MFS transporter [Kribbella sp. VKM Ac-2566]|uniref:MFS transporter n=1 Tax=Kribbella sp. VKM Ac-2566 TaxID=2512218 RepID=UPI0010639298|nr:MFS transporter [Kribbella sp. VKM Ac-2566]TDX08329.1 EmrB/QacA subfamily drug resistance transporter [Kribbella sp. VKM Ac-2566]
MSTNVRTPRATESKWVLALASVGSFMVALDGLVVMTALSTVRRDLGASAAELECAVNAFTLSFAVLLLTGSALGDRFGRRRIFVAGLAIFTGASVMCALAPDAVWLVAARAVQGSGAALVTPVAMAMITAAFPPEQRGRVLGIYSAAIGLAVLSGPVLGGAITEGIAWQWIFWINLPIGLLAIVLVYARVGESFGPRTAVDLPGVVLVTGASLGLIWGLVRGNDAGWSSLEVIGTLSAGGLLSIAFITFERHAPQPMLPMLLFRSRAFAAGNAVSFLLFASNLSGTYLLAQLFQEAFSQGPLEAGLRLLPLTAALAVFAPVTGRIVDRFGARPLIVTGLTMQAVGATWLAAVTDTTTAYAGLVLPMILIGTGTTMTMPACQKAVLGTVTPADIGRASGTFSTMRWFGGTFGLAVALAAFIGTGGYGSPQEFLDGFVPACGVTAGLALLGVAAGAVIPRARSTASIDPVPAPATHASDGPAAQ